MKLKNKHAVVTGGAFGIGKAIAQAFVREGASVTILDRQLDQARQVAAELSARGDQPAFALDCDVGDSAQVARAFAAIDAAQRPVDILVNNAGIIRQHAIVDMPEDEWDLIIRNNLKSVFLCSQAAARRMKAAGRGGRIIAISSIHAVLSEPKCGHYTAAKGGIEAFCRTLATEVARDRITVNYIRPGATYTELTTPMYTDAVVRALYERVPMREIAHADWIAAGAVFLASDDSRYMTGQHLTIDGGYVMDGSLPGTEYWSQ